MPIDLRTRKLAKLVIDYSLFVKPGENVMISGGEEAIPFMVELYKAVILKGAHPVVKFNLPNVSDFFYKYANKEQLEKFPEITMDNVKKCQKYVGIITESNTRELTNVNPKKIAERSKITYPVTEYVCNSKPLIYRCSVAFPCPALAQEAGMSLTEYENFVYGACLLDWKKLGKRMNKIADKFRKGKKVHLIGENVDLKFEIHGKKAVASIATENMPDGEIFMAPVRESLNGWIKFEYSSIKYGKEVSDIYLKFENGKVIESKASKNEDFMKSLLSTDENSSYVGEFGIGCNPKVNSYTNELIFDEKIGGTIHLALGSAYVENGGGNDSALHWDIVKDMKKAKIVLDGKVVQQNGKWVI